MRNPLDQQGLARAVSALLGLVLTAIFAFPILWMVSSAFKDSHSIVADAFPLSLWSFVPRQPTVQNFAALLGPLSFTSSFLNTLIVAVLQVAAVLFVCACAGYVFGRLHFPHRDRLFALALLAAFVPIEAMVLPLYHIIERFGLLSTFAGVVLPFAASPFGIYLMRQSFRGLPDEMFEAASLDGAGEFRKFISIGLPNVVPALTSLALIQFIGATSFYFWPLIALQEPQMQVAQVVISGYVDNANAPLYGPMFAAATVLTMPVILLSLLLQKYYAAGLAGVPKG